MHTHRRSRRDEPLCSEGRHGQQRGLAGRKPRRTTRLQRSCSQELTEFNRKTRRPVFTRAKDLNTRFPTKTRTAKKTPTRLNATRRQGMRTKPARSHRHQDGRCKRHTTEDKARKQPVSARGGAGPPHRCWERKAVRPPRQRPGSSPRPGFTGGGRQGCRQTA